VSDFSTMIISSYSPATKGWPISESLFPFVRSWENAASTIQAFQSAVPSIPAYHLKFPAILSWTESFSLRPPEIPRANTATILAGSEMRASPETLETIQMSDYVQNNSRTAPRVEVVAEWDGYVEEIYDDYFSASMRGLRGAGVIGEEEEAEIPISDVDTEDRDLSVEGGFFRLMIAYESPRVGPKKRYTTVQFRRLPAYTKRELDARDREADELLDGLQLEESNQAAGA
jgi:hypothetical protein